MLECQAEPWHQLCSDHLSFVQEIAKHFDEEEDGFEVVVDAIDTMTCVAWYINDMKRRHEHAVRLQVLWGWEVTGFGRRNIVTLLS